MAVEASCNKLRELFKNNFDFHFFFKEHQKLNVSKKKNDFFFNIT